MILCNQQIFSKNWVAVSTDHSLWAGWCTSPLTNRHRARRVMALLLWSRGRRAARPESRAAAAQRILSSGSWEGHCWGACCIWDGVLGKQGTCSTSSQVCSAAKTQDEAGIIGKARASENPQINAGQTHWAGRQGQQERKVRMKFVSIF